MISDLLSLSAFHLPCGSSSHLSQPCGCFSASQLLPPTRALQWSRAAPSPARDLATCPPPSLLPPPWPQSTSLGQRPRRLRMDSDRIRIKSDPNITFYHILI